MKKYFQICYSEKSERLALPCRRRRGCSSAELGCIAKGTATFRFPELKCKWDLVSLSVGFYFFSLIVAGLQITQHVLIYTCWAQWMASTDTSISIYFMDDILNIWIWRLFNGWSVIRIWLVFWFILQFGNWRPWTSAGWTTISQNHFFSWLSQSSVGRGPPVLVNAHWGNQVKVRALSLSRVLLPPAFRSLNGPRGQAAVSGPDEVKPVCEKQWLSPSQWPPSGAARGELPHLPTNSKTEGGVSLKAPLDPPKWIRFRLVGVWNVMRRDGHFSLPLDLMMKSGFKLEDIKIQQDIHFL